MRISAVNTAVLPDDGLLGTTAFAWVSKRGAQQMISIVPRVERYPDERSIFVRKFRWRRGCCGNNVLKRRLSFAGQQLKVSGNLKQPMKQRLFHVTFARTVVEKQPRMMTDAG